jgi:hypothetical protein
MLIIKYLLKVISFRTHRNMIKKPSDFLLQTLGPDIDFLYLRLQYSMFQIIDLVNKENKTKGHFNPKEDIIIECDSRSEFEKHQSLLRGLNNHVYYNSLILSGYSIFEFALKSICFFVSENYENSEDFDNVDTRHDIISNCVNYIKRTKLVNFNEKKIDKCYTQIKKVHKLRNLIAHDNGNLIKDKNKPLKQQKSFNLFSSDKRLVIFSNGQVFIDDSDYIKDFVKLSDDFLKLIIEKLKK